MESEHACEEVMTITGNKRMFQDMIAKAAGEFDRVCALNAQLHAAVVALGAKGPDAAASFAQADEQDHLCVHGEASAVGLGVSRGGCQFSTAGSGLFELPSDAPMATPYVSDESSWIPESLMVMTSTEKPNSPDMLDLPTLPADVAEIRRISFARQDSPLASPRPAGAEGYLGDVPETLRPVWQQANLESQDGAKEPARPATPISERTQQTEYAGDRRQSRGYTANSFSARRWMENGVSGTARFSDAGSLPRRSSASGRFTVRQGITFTDDDDNWSGPARGVPVTVSGDVLRIFQHTKDAKIRDVLRHTVKGASFNMFFACVVFGHAFFIGYEAHCAATELGHKEPDMDVGHAAFNLVFFIELVLRILADGQRFFTGEAWKWNWLDVSLVAVSAADFFVLRNYAQLQHSGGIRTLRFARILRVMRTVRIMRTVRSVHELHKMLYAVISSFRTLMCASLILSFVMYFFSILFTAAATEERIENPAAAVLLIDYYGTLGRTFRSLFWAVSDGASWGALYEPIADLHWFYGVCFFSYIIIVTFGVMNVVTSVFVESAFLSAQHYRDVLVKDKENAKEVAVRHMKNVFQQMDADGSGEISRAEMEFFLSDVELRQYFEALDLSADDTRMLFRLLDADRSGVIDLEEFCEGCLKLKGEAKSTDVHILMLYLHRFLKKWSDFTEYCEDQFASVAALERAVSARLTSEGKPVTQTSEPYVPVEYTPEPHVRL